MKYSVYWYKIKIDEIVCTNHFVQTIAQRNKKERREGSWPNKGEGSGG
ncbi:hypothetical protein B4109_2682 [Geobacillus stearothermophilus]|uniref:Uncharacterized protein n=1 Tax=Geobacillus stearothermophilus TaxID=1422 RepID=A0A150MM63_GEOSE|nr:hypothetical protein B4109_2682 [Geobacillus stearothermophilus]